MIKKVKITKKDTETWQDYIKNPTDIIDKDNFSTNKSRTSNRFRCDLHGYTLQAANYKVKELILSCVTNNIKEILLITGKGIHSNTDKDIYVSKDFSKLRYSVPEYIQSNLDLSKYILSITEADKKDGGEGAIIIKLKSL